MDTLNQLAVEDRRKNCKCSAEDAKISDRLLGKMQLIGLLVEKRRRKSGRKIKQPDEQQRHPEIFRTEDGFQLLAGVLQSHAVSLLSRTLLLQENVSNWKDC